MPATASTTKDIKMNDKLFGYIEDNRSTEKTEKVSLLDGLKQNLKSFVKK